MLLFLLLSVLLEVSFSKPITLSKNRYQHDDPIDEAGGLQETVLSDRNLKDHGSAIYTELINGKDMPVAEDMDQLQLGAASEDENGGGLHMLLPLQHTLTEQGPCLHPDTKESLQDGSVVFSDKTCTLCECLNGRLNCFKTCET